MVLIERISGSWGQKSRAHRFIIIARFVRVPGIGFCTYCRHLIANDLLLGF